MKTAHRIKLDPNNVQSTVLYKTCGCNRYAFNWMLNEANESYKNGEKFNALELKKKFNAFKKSLDWMQEVNAHAVSNDAADKLNRGFKNFFEKRAKHPRFHSKKNGVGSFSIAGSEVRYDKQNWRVYICRIGWIKLAEEVRFDFTRIYRITISNQAGKWYCSFNLEIVDTPRQCENQAESVGIDLGIKEFATCSDGIVVPNLRVSNTYANRLRRLNKELARRTKGGKNWWKTVYKLRKLHKKIADTRLDYIHKFTTRICKKYGVVCLEDLNVKGMVRNHKLARHISDCSFAETRRQFEYKVLEVKYVDRFFPSSKRCSHCGDIHNGLTLMDRIFVCPHCRFTIDRDLNAAINIKIFAVSSTGSKKFVAKRTTGRKVPNGQKINVKVSTANFL